MHSIRIALLTGLICLLLAPAAIFAQGPGQRHYQAAENLRKQNKFIDAIQLYNEAIKLEPSNYKYYFQRGKSEYNLKKYEAAKESFKSTIDYKNNFTPAYSLLAKIYKIEKDYNNAIHYYKEAAKFETNDNRKVQYNLLLVNLLLREKRIPEARRHVDEARRMAPGNPNVLYYSGEIAATEENWPSAKRAYEQALETEKLKNAPPAQKAKYYYGLGLAYSKMGDNANAKRAWSKANFGPYRKRIAKQMALTNHVYYYKVAVSYYLNGEYAECENHLKKALAIQRNFASAYVLRGKIARKRGDFGQAVTQYQQAISMEQNAKKKAKMYLLVANMQLDMNNARAALNSIQSAFQSNPQGTVSMYNTRARAEYGAGRFNDAVQTLEKLLSMGVDTKAKARFSFMLGMAAKKSSDLERAREAFKNAMYGPYKPAAKTELEKISG